MPLSLTSDINNLTDANHDSGWQPSRYFVDSGLEANSTYSYRVKARDSYCGKETAYSSIQSATTLCRPGPNLLTNPDFETNNWYWDWWINNVWQGGVRRDSTEPHSGTYAGKILAPNERTTHNGNGVTSLDPNKTYQLDMWVKVANLQQGDKPRIGHGGDKWWTYTFAGNTGGWEKFTQTISGIRAIYVFANYEDSNIAGGYMLIDDVTVCEVLP